MCKNLERGSWVEARKLAFFVFGGIGWPCTTTGRLGIAMDTIPAIGAHTGTGGQCADTIYRR